MEKYYAKRDQRMGKARYCDECQITKLSRYNDENICGSCALKSQESSRKAILGMVMAVSA